MARAHKIAPPLDTYLYEKARSLHRGGHHVDAERCYRELLERDPRSTRVLNNLGALLQEQGRSVEAEWAYGRAVEIEPDAPVPHFNMGRLLQLDGRLEMAEAAYRKSIALGPRSFDAHFNLGHLLHEQRRFDEAAAELERAVALDPQSVAAHSCLGGARHEAGRLDDALAAYRRAAELDPASGAERFHMGRVLEDLGRFDEAAAEFGEALARDTDSVAAREHLVHALLRAGRTAAAAESLREWLAFRPGHPIALHLLASVTGEAVPERASDEYVRDTFDRFAADFDLVLERLGYRAPRAIAEALESLAAPGAALDVLDLGCGTGLCGALVRGRARRLTGVDLSPGMLARARARGDYDELVEGELGAFLAGRAAEYDAIVCADTLCYFGALDGVLGAAARALRPAGLLVFTLERLEDAGGAGHRLETHGRYAHHEDHVRSALRAAGLDPLRLEPIALRREGEADVPGLLVAAVRPAGGPPVSAA